MNTGLDRHICGRLQSSVEKKSGPEMKCLCWQFCSWVFIIFHFAVYEGYFSLVSRACAAFWNETGREAMKGNSGLPTGQEKV